MHSQTCRPARFEDVAGQVLARKTLKAIVKDPSNSPHSLIFQGIFGGGKTTCSRIFARALNCEDKSSVEPCMKCESCHEDLDSSSYYVEYDSAMVGNVERIRELRDTFYISMSKGYRVITLDEIHMASAAAQNALLKAVEEVKSNIFFIFATTDVDRIIPTIRSRSLEIRFDPVPHDQVVSNLKKVLLQENVTASDKVLNVIASRSRGHMRNAHMYLDTLTMLGEEEFLESVRSSYDDFLHYFYAVSQKNKEAAFKALDVLCSYPLADLRVDFQQVCLSMAQTLVGYKKVDGLLFETTKGLGAEVLKLVKLAASEWLINCFDSDQAFQAAMLCLYQMLAGATGASAVSRQQNHLDRLGKQR